MVAPTLEGAAGLGRFHMPDQEIRCCACARLLFKMETGALSGALDRVRAEAKAEGMREAAALVTANTICTGDEGNFLIRRRDGAQEGMAYAEAILAAIPKEGV